MDTTSVEAVTQETTEEINAFLQLIQNNTGALVGLGLKVVFAIIFFLIGRYLIKWVRKVVKAAFERSSADPGVATFVDSLLKFGLYAILIFMIATKFGVDTTSVAAIIASAGVAVGLALQGSLSNFAGGVLILLLKPFVVGDYIIEDNHKNEGTVKEIQLFYTKLTTIDNKTIVIPNGMLTNNSLTNVTEKNERRLDLKIGISYDSDLRKAKDVIRRLLEEEERIKKDEEILIFVDELGASSVVLGVRAWVSTDEFWNVKWKLLEEIKLAMDAEGIEIPYQQVAVHMKEE
ncbi:MAG: mechanosensitive ion channel [Dorea sp.]|nr:mechanosensitive ion channel [Dorea sp.]MDY2812826.1 mechanosensitive ion channel [Dorea sp.]